jgi:DNA-binding MarR family transcriptional regulator
MEEADLERLLARLLRVVSPAWVGDAGTSQPPVKEDTRSAAGEFPALSTSEARALIELMAARGIPQGQLAALLGLEKSTVSRLAAGLERKGWIRRGRDEQNQRYMRLYLTPEGTAVAGRVWRAWQSRQARIVAALSPQERTGLAAGLSGLVRELTAEGLLGGQPAPSGDAGHPLAGQRDDLRAPPRADRARAAPDADPSADVNVTVDDGRTPDDDRAAEPDTPAAGSVAGDRSEPTRR